MDPVTSRSHIDFALPFKRGHGSASAAVGGRSLITTTMMALFLVWLPAVGWATTKVHVGVDGSSWNTAGNWNPGGVPGFDDDITLGSTVETATTNLTVNPANSPTLTVGGNNTSTSEGAVFTGAGTPVKTGTGVLTFGFGASDTSANTDTLLGITVNAGQLTLNKAAGITAVAGNLNINRGTVLLAASNQIANTSAVTLAGGTFTLAGFNETLGSLADSGTVALGGGTLTVG